MFLAALALLLPIASALPRFPTCHCIARDGAVTESCLASERRAGSVGVPAAYRHLRQNLTGALLDSGHPDPPAWLLTTSNAITEVVDAALATRTLCGMPPWEDCPRFMEVFGQSWCAFLRRLRGAARMLPREGLVTSALNTSVAELLVDVLPEMLAEPVIGVAAGSVALGDGLDAIRNASTICVFYLENAMFMGSEMLRFGTSRVAAAVFHGESAGAGWREGLIHRADVLLWALRYHGGPDDPLIAEIGVAHADVPTRLLSVNQGLRWVGVDPYEGRLQEDGSLDTRPEAGNRGYAFAKAQLARWLGDRARLLRARSTDVSAEMLEGVDPFDLVFVDALHTEEAALEDIAAWAPRVRPGGIVAGHDYDRNYPGVVEAAHAMLPKGVTLHLGPNSVFWWQKPE